MLWKDNTELKSRMEAMINVLERKGLLTGKEVMDELEVIVATKGKKEVN